MSGVKRKRNVLNVKQKFEILQQLDKGESASADAEDVLNEGNTISHSAALQSVETLLDSMGQRGFDYGDMTAPTSSPARLQLDCSENVDEEAVGQWINEDSTLECCEALSDDDIVSRVTCGSEEARNFEECPESDDENLVTHQKLSHGDALVHTDALLNYLEKEDESTPAEKMILRNLRSILRRRVNKKQKQTSIISFSTKQ
ncbi:hypothetical protein AVEN_176684-1 [Araneus ventricosus]|uniref:HTH psq-type domain-containing protein n=1 Tax=Araneus ventricosus TaxID=182803 RepID=A0A4Y2SIQ2_ARAVE|nr:hypothetical protein AVEN_176684-1 [Araneus ventricosus]